MKYSLRCIRPPQSHRGRGTVHPLDSQSPTAGDDLPSCDQQLPTAAPASGLSRKQSIRKTSIDTESDPIWLSDGRIVVDRKIKIHLNSLSVEFEKRNSAGIAHQGLILGNLLFLSCPQQIAWLGADGLVRQAGGETEANAVFSSFDGKTMDRFGPSAVTEIYLAKRSIVWRCCPAFPNYTGNARPIGWVRS